MPPSRSSWPRPGPRSSGPRCTTSASGSQRTCTTTSSSGCSPPGCRCRRSPRHRRPGPVRRRISATIADLDDTISQIRTSIFQLQQTSGTQPRGLRARLLDVVAAEIPALGLDPAVRFSGPLDTLPDDVADDLVAVLREALSNIARHARARSAEVDLTAGAERITLEVHDDGIGLGPTRRRSGLANLRRRAELHGGRLTLAPRRPTGTDLSWTIPNS